MPNEKKKIEELQREIIKLRARISDLETSELHHETLEKQLTESEEKFRLLFETAGAGILYMDTKGIVVDFNPKIQEIAGYERSELLGKHFLQLIPIFEINAANMVKAFQEIISGGPLRNTQWHITNKQGKKLTVLAHPSLGHRGGKLVGITVILEDITNRKSAEEKLQIYTDKLERLLDTAREVTSSLDIEAVLWRIGNSAKELLKAHACGIYLLEEDGNTLNPVVAIDPQYEKEIMSTPIAVDASFTGQAIQAQKGLIFNDAAHNPSGQQIPGTPEEQDERIIAVPFMAGKRALGAMCLNRFGIEFYSEDLSLAETFATFASTALQNAQTYNDLLREVSERQQAEEARQTERAYFDQLFESAQEGIVMADNQGRIIHANQEFLRLFGYSQGEVTGQYVDTLVATEDLLNEAKQVTHQASIGERTALESLRKRKDGSMINVSILASPIIIRGKQVAVYAIYRNITERKKAVDSLKQSYERTQQILTATVDTLALAAEKRDPYTAGHQQRVAQLARAIAEEMGYPKDTIEGIYMAGIIHDIGKIHVPAEILTKPTALTELELNIMKTHSHVGFDILKDIDFPWPIATIILQHHERLNGSGYPQELRGDDILEEAKIIAVADVVEAMSSHRPYRPARSLELTLAEIQKNKGILYDNKVVDVCLSLFKKKAFRFKDAH